MKLTLQKSQFPKYHTHLMVMAGLLKKSQGSQQKFTIPEITEDSRFMQEDSPGKISFTFFSQTETTRTGKQLLKKLMKYFKKPGGFNHPLIVF